MDNIPVGYNDEGEPIGFDDPRALLSFEEVQRRLRILKECDSDLDNNLQDNNE